MLYTRLALLALLAAVSVDARALSQAAEPSKVLGANGHGIYHGLKPAKLLKDAKGFVDESLAHVMNKHRKDAHARAAAMEMTTEMRESLTKFHKMHTEKGSHHHEDVPEHIRGDKFTVENLHKYFSVARVGGEGHTTDKDLQMPVEEKKEEVSRKLLGTPTMAEIQQIIEIGKDAWKFIKDNKPVVNKNTDYAGAVPKPYADQWSSMAGWKSYNTRKSTWEYVNGFGSSVVKLSFTWTTRYNGQANVENVGAVGRYLTNTGVAYETLQASWGYTVDMSVTAENPLNVGTFDKPIASLDMEMKLQVSTVLKDITDKCHVRVDGDRAYFKRVACANGVYW